MDDFTCDFTPVIACDLIPTSCLPRFQLRTESDYRTRRLR